MKKMMRQMSAMASGKTPVPRGMGGMGMPGGKMPKMPAPRAKMPRGFRFGK
jgi:hypothetical protein